MAKEIVNAFASNKIYLASIGEDGTMNDIGRKDITEDVIVAMFLMMQTNYEQNNKSRLYIHGVGELKFTPDSELTSLTDWIVRYDSPAAAEEVKKAGTILHESELGFIGIRSHLSAKLILSIEGVTSCEESPVGSLDV